MLGIDDEALKFLVNKKSAIPKPETDKEFRVLRYGIRRGERAIIYSIPCNNNQRNHYEKVITFSEFNIVLKEISEKGYVTRAWFNKNLTACAKEGSCNFTSLCGILELLGYVKYTGKARYEKI